MGNIRQIKKGGRTLVRDIDLLLINGNLIDGTGSAINKNVCIGVKNKKILFIEKMVNENAINDKCKILNLDGATILPGFINAHAHTGFKFIKDKLCEGFQDKYLDACIREGITTIRDEGMLSANSIDDMLKQKNLLDKVTSYPNVIMTGKFFTAPGGYGGQAPITVTTVEEVRQKVNEILDKDIKVIKTVLDDGMDPSTFGLPKLSEELLKEICDVAHSRGAKVSAHVTQAHNLKALVRAGINDAGHMVYDDLSDDLISEMIEKDIYFVPTLTVFKFIQDKYGAPILENSMNNLKRFIKAGGKIALGDDFIEEEEPWYRLGMPLIEIELLQQCGLTPMEIIVAATKHGSEVCNASNEIGTVETGKNADLLILKDNPLEDLNNIRNIFMVIKDGNIIVNKDAKLKA